MYRCVMMPLQSSRFAMQVDIEHGHRPCGSNLNSLKLRLQPSEATASGKVQAACRASHQWWLPRHIHGTWWNSWGKLGGSSQETKVSKTVILGMSSRSLFTKPWELGNWCITLLFLLVSVGSLVLSVSWDPIIHGCSFLRRSPFRRLRSVVSYPQLQCCVGQPACEVTFPPFSSLFPAINYKPPASSSYSLAIYPWFSQLTSQLGGFPGPPWCHQPPKARYPMPRARSQGLHSVGPMTLVWEWMWFDMANYSIFLGGNRK